MQIWNFLRSNFLTFSGVGCARSHIRSSGGINLVGCMHVEDRSVASRMQINFNKVKWKLTELESTFLKFIHIHKITKPHKIKSCPSVHGGGGVSRKGHSEHIVATKVLMPVGGVSRKVNCEHILATKVLMPVGGLGVRESALWAHCCYKSAHAHGGVSGKVHSEDILATKVLMSMGGGGVRGSVLWAHSYYPRGMQSIFELPSCSKCEYKARNDFTAR